MSGVNMKCDLNVPDLFKEQESLLIEAICGYGGFDEKSRKRIHRLFDGESVLFDVVVDLCKCCEFELFLQPNGGAREVVPLTEFGAAIKSVRKTFAAELSQEAFAAANYFNKRTLIKCEKLNADCSTSIRIANLVEYLSIFDYRFGIQRVKSNLKIWATFTQ